MWTEARSQCAMVVETLDAARVPRREAFVGGGVATVGAAVEAGLSVAALSRRTARPGSTDAGTWFGPPALPTREAMLHPRIENAAAASLRLLVAAFRSGV